MLRCHPEEQKLTLKGLVSQLRMWDMSALFTVKVTAMVSAHSLFQLTMHVTEHDSNDPIVYNAVVV